MSNSQLVHVAIWGPCLTLMVQTLIKFIVIHACCSFGNSLSIVI